MRILVTGGTGMVGKSLKKYYPTATYISSKDYNLTSKEEVERMFARYKPEVVIHLAARVGGILDNISKPAEYFDDNVLMNTLILQYAYKFNVRRFIGILSTCAYPDVVKKYPMTEEMLHLGPPTATNFSYGYAKRALAVQIEAYNAQYGLNYQYLIPCNLYGVNDKFDGKSHLVGALVKKVIQAKKRGEKKIVLLGDGTPLRQFMHADDLAFVIHRCIEDEVYANMNVAYPKNLTVKEIAQIVINACDAQLEIEFDTMKPNGQHRKDVSIKRLKEHIPSFSPIPLDQGVKELYKQLNSKSKSW